MERTRNRLPMRRVVLERGDDCCLGRRSRGSRTRESWNNSNWSPNDQRCEGGAPASQGLHLSLIHI
eukprot:3294688-Alexandrium_andersonii.AAC.1